MKDYLTIQHALILVALLLALLNGITGKIPLWIAVFFVCVALLLK